MISCTSYFGLIAVGNYFKYPSLQVFHVRDAQSGKENSALIKILTD